MKYYSLPNLEKLTEKIVELMPPVERFFLNDATLLKNSEDLYNYHGGLIIKNLGRKKIDYTIRVIDENNENLGVLKTSDALRAANERGIVIGVIF